MSRVSTVVDAPADEVWAVLADGWTYANWVVGTVKIRDVEPGWPEVGRKLHHAVGVWPLLLQDETEVVACEPQQRLQLQARGWPLGEATVEVLLEPDGERTLVQLHEQPTHGPGALLHNRVLDKLVDKRNEETLDRLRRLVEGHHRDRKAQVGPVP